MQSTEELIIHNLIYNKEFVEKALPYLKQEYFEHDAERIVFRHIDAFFADYNTMPTVEALFIEISKDGSISEGHEKQVEKLLGSLKQNQNMPLPELQWLINIAEKYCQERAVYNALSDCITITKGEDKKRNKGAIPDILKDALSVSFDVSIGHDYFEDSEIRYKYYTKREEKIPFALDYFNKITLGGVYRKSLNLFYGGVHAGKTGIMCSLAADHLRLGYNVLYISLEMSENQIAKRIDANLLDIPMNHFEGIDENSFINRLAVLHKKYNGRLKIKEYPTSAAHVGHFRALLNEYKFKQGFVPDIIYIDYLNIAASQRFKAGSNSNSYEYVKAISEEVRGLGVENNLCIFSATQFNRSNYASSDPGMDGVAESFGVGFSADCVYALVATKELIEQGKMMIKQLKSRYDDISRIPKFFVGFDREKMRFYDLDDAEVGISPEPVHTPITMKPAYTKNKLSKLFDEEPVPF